MTNTELDIFYKVLNELIDHEKENGEDHRYEDALHRVRGNTVLDVKELEGGK